MISLLNLPQIANYKTLELLHESDRTLVYRARNAENGQPVVIKLMREEYPSFNELVQFRNQYVISKNLEIEGIVKPYALERYENRYALMMEDVGSLSLAEYKGRNPLPLSQFFNIAIQLAEILHQLHHNQIIHKDIKPANILISPQTQQIKLIDFSISTLLPKETQTVKTPNVLEGTLAYIAPEQTGRMNRGIDYRSDFYSLGATLYELLAGRLPFNSNDPMELVHAHIAQQPIPPCDWLNGNGENHPQSLSDIILKLMAKNAEDRYQSALGLKHDLEKCQQQWQEKGAIAPFVLGERDLCDRFLIPEKLYGREKEVQALLNAFERVSRGASGASGERNILTPPASPSSPASPSPRAELVLVAGFSGIGKTAVVNEVHKPIVKNRGYFIKGKFDQFNRNIPLSAFVRAFRDLMGQLLGESDADLQKWKANILAALGENGQVLLDVIPELENIIGAQPPVPKLEGSAVQNRFNLLFQKFIAVFTTPEHPLTIFIDDLQWADSASLNLLKVLMEDSQTGYLLLLGAYRDNEVFPAHPLMLTLAELRCDPASAKAVRPRVGESGANAHQDRRKGTRTKTDARERAPREQNATISTIVLAPLSVDCINQWVAETLSCPVDLAAPLTDLVYQKTKGNPFFTTQFLKGLYEDELIIFNRDLRYWECDLVKVREAALTDDVVEFMARRLHKLPQATQNVLKLAACIGNQFDLETLAIICETPLEEVAAALWSALRDGLILPQSEAYKFFQGKVQREEYREDVTIGYRFLHDRVQQAAYSLIPLEYKSLTHYKIGRILIEKTSLLEREERIFDIVGHLNLGVESIDEQSQQWELADLNLLAGQKAKNATAYQSAFNYLKQGLRLLPSHGWETRPELTLNLHCEAMQSGYLSGNIDESESLGEIVLQQVQNQLDAIKVYETKIQIYITSRQTHRAINTGLEALAMMGMSLAEIKQCNSHAIALPPIATVSELLEARNPYDLAKMRILTAITSAALISRPDILFSIVAKQVLLCRDCGYSVLAAFAYSWYGALLCVNPAEINKGYQSGQLAIALLERFQKQARVEKCSIYNMVYTFITPWKRQARESLSYLLEGSQNGLEVGDFVYASYCLENYCTYLFLTGSELVTATQQQTLYIELMQKIKNDYAATNISIWRQLCENLLGRAANEERLEGEYLNEAAVERHWQESQLGWSLFNLYLAQTLLSYHLGNYSQAIAKAVLAKNYVVSVGAWMPIATHNFYYSLALLANWPASSSPFQREEILLAVQAHQEELGRWARNAPMNYQHQWDLVEAERQYVLGNKAEAVELYDRAIAGAKENDYLPEEALANELAAKFYLNWGKDKIAAAYLQDAYYSYSRWGAKAKTDQLERLYPQLLSPILNAPKCALTANATLSRIGTKTISSSTTGVGVALDLASLMKASRTLTEAIDLDCAIANLMHVVRENAGAETVALMLFREKTLTLEALAANGRSAAIDPMPANECDCLPLTLINQVKHTHQALVLDNASQDACSARDPYLHCHQPQSVLCLPLIDRGQLVGILYLENNQAVGAFTSDRVAILNLLCSQAAITLQNAQLYDKERQAQNSLQQALTDLQQAQLQLVQGEKMAALGNLVAGVAHEINNPIGFIGGNVEAAQDHLQDLLEILSLYQANAAIPESIVQKIADLDPEFIAEDFPKLIASMRKGCDRIRNISTSLRTFSRSDAEKKTEFNLQEGLDSTLLILKYRLKANEERPGIEIVKNYGEIPAMKCYAGQINQVFMNILANAIDVFDEMAQTMTFKELETESQQIIIQTELGDDCVSIRIRDNGKGMTADVKARIFDHLFTTKTIGKGTGLGLALARQIVMEKHGGAIACHSELGKGTEFMISLPIC